MTEKIVLSWPEAVAILMEPFPESEIEWRVARETHDGQVQVLAYLDARMVERRLDDVFGPFGWGTRVTYGPGGVIGCELSVQLPSGEWITKSNCADATDIEAAKGGYSTAFKRAAAHGLGIGRYLYDRGETIVPLTTVGSHTHKGKDGRWYRWDPPTDNPDAEQTGAGAVNYPVPARTGPDAPAERTSPAPAAVGGAPASTTTWPEGEVPKCPKCHGPMWDNRTDKRNPRSPDYKCKARTCGHGVWLDSKEEKFDDIQY